MTLEERKRRKAERDSIKGREVEMFPRAFYTHKDLQLICDAGCDNFIKIRTNRLSQFTPSVNGGEQGWVEAWFWIGDIGPLAEFVAALSMRLKHRIQEANEDIRKTVIPVLELPGEGK